MRVHRLQYLRTTAIPTHSSLLFMAIRPRSAALNTVGMKSPDCRPGSQLRPRIARSGSSSSHAYSGSAQMVIQTSGPPTRWTFVVGIMLTRRRPLRDWSRIAEPRRLRLSDARPCRHLARASEISELGFVQMSNDGTLRHFRRGRTNAPRIVRDPLLRSLHAFIDTCLVLTNGHGESAIAAAHERVRYQAFDTIHHFFDLCLTLLQQIKQFFSALSGISS